MEFIFTLLAGIFITLLIGVVVTFGFALLTAIIMGGVGLWLLIHLRQAIRRQLFMRAHEPPPIPRQPRRKKPVDANGEKPIQLIIDAEYEEVPPKKRK